MQVLTLFPAVLSDNSRTRECSSLKFLAVPHAYVIRLLEGDSSSGNVNEIFHSILPRSIWSLELQNCLPDYKIETVVEQLAALKSCGWLINLKDVTLKYASNAQLYERAISVVVSNPQGSVAEALKESGIVVNVHNEGTPE